MLLSSSLEKILSQTKIISKNKSSPRSISVSILWLLDWSIERSVWFIIITITIIILVMLITNTISIIIRVICRENNFKNWRGSFLYSIIKPLLAIPSPSRSSSSSSIPSPSSSSSSKLYNWQQVSFLTHSSPSSSIPSLSSSSSSASLIPSMSESRYSRSNF